MHRAFAAWLTAKPWRAFLFTAIFGFLAPQGLSPTAVAAGAIPVLMTLARDERWGWHTALTGIASVGAYLVARGEPATSALLFVAQIFAVPFGLSLVLRRTGSLRLCFQLAVLCAGIVLATLYIAMDDPVARWDEMLRATVKQFAQAGLLTDERTLLESLARTNWGTLVSLSLVSWLASFFLGCWWQSLTQSPGSFGNEYRQLRLGKVLGVLALLTVLSAFAFAKLLTPAPFLEALVWIAVVALAFQGLAAVHRRKSSGKVGGAGLVVATYVLLVVAAPIVVMVLAGWGVADNWRRSA